jgi:hypothetical protein
LDFQPKEFILETSSTFLGVPFGFDESHKTAPLYSIKSFIVSM